MYAMVLNYALRQGHLNLYVELRCKKKIMWKEDLTELHIFLEYECELVSCSLVFLGSSHRFA